ncbi:hypothetical protein CPTSV76_096 [Enterobacteria phage SV76]|nr:hypothetical protein CPTSV76_096 [Enterobacteria phage SV76]
MYLIKSLANSLDLAFRRMLIMAIKIFMYLTLLSLQKVVM